ncbi:homoserine kinase [bacterium]|nr:MAG: homoserine kinase [bacterium]
METGPGRARRVGRAHRRGHGRRHLRRLPVPRPRGRRVLRALERRLGGGAPRLRRPRRVPQGAQGPESRSDPHGQRIERPRLGPGPARQSPHVRRRPRRLQAPARGRVKGRVRVSVPATTSNLGPGFDVLGMALSLRMTAVVEALPEGPRTPPAKDDLVSRSFWLALPPARRPAAVRIAVASEIPPARGLGSSAAARLCGVLAAAALDGWKTHSFDDAVALVAALEGHPDNTVPAAYGGLRSVLMDRGVPLHAAWPVPKGLAVALCVPGYEAATPKMRAALPKNVPLHDAAANAARVAHLLACLKDGRLGELRAAMADALHQPYRAKHLPGFREAVSAAEKAGAYGAALSGSGSTVLAFCPAGRAQSRVAAAMARAYARRGIASRPLCVSVDPKGALVS